MRAAFNPQPHRLRTFKRSNDPDFIDKLHDIVGLYMDPPAHASWLNQIACWFSILTRRALKGASFTSPREVRQAIDRFIAAYNQDAAPFEWRKAKVHAVPLKHKYADLMLSFRQRSAIAGRMRMVC